MEKPVFIMDLDGVLTDGCFLYDVNGKAYKQFGPDDADALKLIKDDVELVFVSADHRGFPISQKRINDMGYQLNLVKTAERFDWIKERFVLENVIYMGDSFVDLPIFQKIWQHKGHCITTNDCFYLVKDFSCISYVTHHDGGKRAVADAVFWIAKTFLNKDIFDLLKLDKGV